MIELAIVAQLSGVVVCDLLDQCRIDGENVPAVWTETLTIIQSVARCPNGYEIVLRATKEYACARSDAIKPVVK